MNESGPENPNTRKQGDCLCGTIRRGLQEAAEMLTPPESAGNHFREARLELLRGVRELVDHRIERLSRTKPGSGTRIVVE
jgi:hypothetical protein